MKLIFCSRESEGNQGQGEKELGGEEEVSKSAEDLPKEGLNWSQWSQWSQKLREYWGGFVMFR